MCREYILPGVAYSDSDNHLGGENSEARNLPEGRVRNELELEPRDRSNTSLGEKVNNIVSQVTDNEYRGFFESYG